MNNNNNIQKLGGDVGGDDVGGGDVGGDDVGGGDVGVDDVNNIQNQNEEQEWVIIEDIEIEDARNYDSENKRGRGRNG